MFKLSLLPFAFFAAVIRRPDGTVYPADYFEGDADNPPLRYQLEDVISDKANRRMAERIAELMRIVERARKP